MNKKRILYIKLFAGTALIFFLIFFTWKSSYSEYCFSVIFILIMLLIVSYGYIELKMQERHCVKECYFKPDAFFAKVLSSRFFVSVFYIVISIIMSVLTFMVSLDFPNILWWYFILHIVLSIFLFRVLNHLLKNTFKEKYQRLFSREWSIWIMAILLMGVFIYISLNSTTPEYLSHSLKETIMNARASVSSNCEYIAEVLKFGKMIDGSFWWVIHESADQINNTVMKTGIWFAFLVYNSLALLGINRFIMQIIYMLHLVFDNKKEEI